MGSHPVVGSVLLALAAQSASPRAQEERLALDELIDRLPRVEDEWAEPMDTPELHPASAELKHRLAKGVTLSSDQWRRALLGSGALRVRPRWPAGEPFALSLRQPEWLAEHVLVLDPLRWDVPLRSACVGYFYRGLCGNPVGGKPQAWLHQPLGPLPIGPHALDLRIEVWKGEEDDSTGFEQDTWLEEHLARDAGERPRCAFAGLEPRAPRLVAASEMTIEIEIVPSLDAALPPTRSPAVDEAVRRALVLCVDLRGPGERTMLRFEPAEPLDSLLDGLALSLEVVLLCDAEVRETRKLHRCEHCEDCDFFSLFLPGPHANSLQLPVGFEQDLRERARWSLRPPPRALSGSRVARSILARSEVYVDGRNVVAIPRKRRDAQSRSPRASWR